MTRSPSTRWALTSTGGRSQLPAAAGREAGPGNDDKEPDVPFIEDTIIPAPNLAWVKRRSGNLRLTPGLRRFLSTLGDQSPPAISELASWCRVAEPDAPFAQHVGDAHACRGVAARALAVLAAVIRTRPQAAAELAQGKQPSVDLAPYSLDRFRRPW